VLLDYLSLEEAAAAPASTGTGSGDKLTRRQLQQLHRTAAGWRPLRRPSRPTPAPPPPRPPKLDLVALLAADALDDEELALLMAVAAATVAR
jgi:hypothetical protein